MTRIVADIGNTACKFVRMQGLQVEARRRLTHSEAMDGEALAACFHALYEGRSGPIEVVCCSVVPAVYSALEGFCMKHDYALLPVTPEELPHLKLGYATLETLGVDRFCNAVAAAGLYGVPCITVDMGTATTINVVNAAGSFIGGAIGVGLRTGYRALHAYTAQLPELEPQWPERFTGITTEESMHVGVAALHVFGLQGLIAKISSDFVTRTTVCFTGGNMKILPPEAFPGAVFEPDLLLKGATLYADAKKTKKS